MSIKKWAWNDGKKVSAKKKGGCDLGMAWKQRLWKCEQKNSAKGNPAEFSNPIDYCDIFWCIGLIKTYRKLSLIWAFQGFDVNETRELIRVAKFRVIQLSRDALRTVSWNTHFWTENE